MKFISNYRVCYNGRFYEAGSPFQIRDEDADTMQKHGTVLHEPCLLYTSPSPRDLSTSRMPSSA